MTTKTFDPNRDAEWQRKQGTYKNEADQTPRREGGDDALAEAHPTDPANDQKVISNHPKKTAALSVDKRNLGEEAKQ